VTFISCLRSGTDLEALLKQESATIYTGALVYHSLQH